MPVCADCKHYEGRGSSVLDRCTHPENVAKHKDPVSGEPPGAYNMREMTFTYPNQCGKAGKLFEPKGGAFKAAPLPAEPYRPEPEQDIHESQRDYGTRPLPKPRKRSRFWPMLALFFADPDQWNERMNQWLHRRLGEKHE